MSRDTAEMQIEKLVLTDQLHLREPTAANIGRLHPWSQQIINKRVAPSNLPDSVRKLRNSKPEKYKNMLELESERLTRIYLNLARQRY